MFLSGNRGFQYTLVSPEDLGIADIPNDKFFYVNFKEARYIGPGSAKANLDLLIYALNDGPGTDCKIPVDQEKSEDLYCIMDIPEASLWFTELSLEYNAPPGLCEYLDFKVPWHYNLNVGDGPSTICECKAPESGFALEIKTGETENGTPEYSPVDLKNYFYKKDCNDTEPENGVPVNNLNLESTQTEASFANICPLINTNNKCAYSNVRTTRCAEDEKCVVNDNKEETCIACSEDEKCPTNKACGDLEHTKCTLARSDLKPKETDLCPFSHKGVLCCTGEYALYKAEGKPETKDWATNDSSSGVSKCLGGLARISWPPNGTEGSGFNKEGYPKPATTSTQESGFVGTYTIPALLNVLDDSRMPSFVSATYWENWEEGLPWFYLRRLQPTPSGHPFLTYICMDDHREVKHRIHFMIREWNTKAEFLKFKEGGNGNPDIPEIGGNRGTEGKDCAYFDPTNPKLFGFSEHCNDMIDIDDFVKMTEKEDPKNNSSPPFKYPRVVYRDSGGDSTDDSSEE